MSGKAKADAELRSGLPSTIALAKIRMDGGTQPRERISEDVTADYAELMKGGRKLPPVVVYYDGTDYWLSDGFHRVLAAQAIERSRVAAEVRQGTQRDAVLHSCGVNAEHGVRRTNADKRRAVRKLLEDAEWSQWSDREVARRSAVSPDFANRLRREMRPSVIQGQTPQGSARKVTRGGTTYTQQTERIGKVTKARAGHRGEPERVPIPEKPTAQLDEEREQIRRQFGVFNALEALASVPMDAAGFIDGLAPEQRYRIKRDLERAYAWISDLYAKWG